DAGAGFLDEGAVARAPIRVVDGRPVAEVDLATSFNPGDNFRVAASLDQGALVGLDAQTGGPTVGAPQSPLVRATPQLAIWRSVHVERDRMAPLTPRGPVAGVARAVQPGRDPQTAVVQTDLTLPGGAFLGGLLRDATGQAYLITGQGDGSGAAVTVAAGP